MEKLSMSPAGIDEKVEVLVDNFPSFGTSPHQLSGRVMCEAKTSPVESPKHSPRFTYCSLSLAGRRKPPPRTAD
jgi:hypothetical protein